MYLLALIKIDVLDFQKKIQDGVSLIYTQTSEAIKTFKNLKNDGPGTSPGSEASTSGSFGAADKDFDISSALHNMEQTAHRVKVNVENLAEPLKNVMKEKVTEVKIKQNPINETVKIEESIRSDHLRAAVYENSVADKEDKVVDQVNFNKVDFDKVGDIGLAGPKVAVTEKVVESFKSETRQPRQQPKGKVLSNFKPKVRDRSK